MPSLPVLVLALAIAEASEWSFHQPMPATPFIADLNRARGEYLARIEASRCSEGQDILSALQRQYPSERFFLLWPDEAVWADFLCGNWPALLDPLRYTPRHLGDYAGRTAPDWDGGAAALASRFRQESDGIAQRIASEVSGEEQKEYLLLYLARLREPSGLRPGRGHADIGMRADRWLAKHPGSPYRDFVRGQIRNAYRPAPFGFGGSLLAGTFLPAGEMGEHVDRLAGIGFSFEFLAYKASLRGSLIVDFGTGLERDLMYDSLAWKRGGKFSMSYGDLQMGLEALRGPRAGIEPFLSYGFVQMKNGDAEDSLEKAEDYRFLQNFPTLGAGVRAHWYFADPSRNQIGYAGLTLGYRHFDLERRFPGMGGGESYLEIHLGARFRGRVKHLE